MQMYDEDKFVKNWRKRDVAHQPVKKSVFVRTLIKYVKLYCKYTKLAGFKFFVEPGRTWIDRTLWSLLYAITMPLMIFTIYSAYLQFMDKPFFISVDAEYYPTYKLNFPGVAICNVNRISRQTAMEIANEIFQVNISRLSTEEIVEMISQLGDLYETDYMTQKRIFRIDQLLSLLDDGSYDMTKVMKRLAPQCSTMLISCRYQNDDQNCSEAFTFRKTQYGFCCTFNYATKGDDLPVKSGIDHKTNPNKVSDLGERGGLTLIIDPMLNDYFYSMAPVTGWMVTIFNPHDYPDIASGGVADILLPVNTYMNVEVEAIKFYSTSDIKPYTDKRYCVFPEEMPLLRDSYTYSDCIVHCRAKDIWKICKCIPFYLPNRESRRVCNLEDIPCLRRHKSKWFSVIPHEESFNAEAMNTTWALRCKQCYPECNDISYITSVSTARLAPGNYSSKTLQGTEVRNHSALHVYFNHFDTISVRQDVIFRWYEILSEASGMCGIFVGFSIIAVVEFGYFVGLFVLDLCKQASPSENEIERERLSIRAIYWGELYPSTKTETMSNRYDRNRDKY